MPSTEFLLYLVSVILVVFLIINHYKDDRTEPDIQYKYIPVYKSDNNNSSSESKRNNESTQYNNHHQYGHRMMSHHNNLPHSHAPPMNPAMPPPTDPLRKFDYDAVHDEFTPPFRRSYYDDYNYRLHPGLYPTYTRGPPGRFRKIGTLIAEGVSSNDKYKFMNMIGREKYPGRDYEYYATSANNDLRVKFYIDTKGKEIHDGDIVNISELDGYEYKFKEDPDLSPRYDPYLI